MHFVEDGVTYDEGAKTVSSLIYPNADTYPEPWEENAMGCVIDSQITKEFTEDTDECFGPNGYEETVDRYLRKVEVGISLKAHSELIHRLIWMLKNKITNGTPQTPFIGRDFVEGWVHLQYEADDTQPRYISVLRAKMRLDQDPKWSKDPSKPAVKLEVSFRNVLNTMLPSHISA